MGLQKFRADEEHAPYANGGRPFYTRWMGGPSLALVRNCPTMFGPRTVYATGEADTYFSLPAACTVRGRWVRGFLTFDDGPDNGARFNVDFWRYAPGIPSLSEECARMDSEARSLAYLASKGITP
jgi:hypothetical protein